MKIGALRERLEGEARVALTPESASQLKKLGHEPVVESGAGIKAGISDDAYRAAGVTVVDSAQALAAAADVIVKVRPPTEDEVSLLSPGKTLISFFYPAINKDLLERASSTGANIIAMDSLVTSIAEVE